jgi:hypothetical protein
MRETCEPIVKRDQSAMLREWFSEVVKHAAFVFVDDGEQFLTIYMASARPGQLPYLTSGGPAMASLRKLPKQPAEAMRTAMRSEE